MDLATLIPKKRVSLKIIDYIQRKVTQFNEVGTSLSMNTDKLRVGSVLYTPTSNLGKHSVILSNIRNQ